MSPGWMALRNLLLIVGLPMLWIVTGRVQRKGRERQAASQRRRG